MILWDGSIFVQNSLRRVKGQTLWFRPYNSPFIRYNDGRLSSSLDKMADLETKPIFFDFYQEKN
jgi:hypothetical protein